MGAECEPGPRDHPWVAVWGARRPRTHALAGPQGVPDVEGARHAVRYRRLALLLVPTRDMSPGQSRV